MRSPNIKAVGFALRMSRKSIAWAGKMCSLLELRHEERGLTDAEIRLHEEVFRHLDQENKLIDKLQLLT